MPQQRSLRHSQGVRCGLQLVEQVTLDMGRNEDLTSHRHQPRQAQQPVLTHG